MPFQRGVVLKNEQLDKLLSPGSHWISPKRTLLLCDMRSKPFQIPAQEMLTADGMGVRMSLGGEYRITNPVFFIVESSDSFGAFYLEMRQALHLAVKELNSETIFGGQTLLSARIKELVVPRGTQLGIEITQLEIWEAVPIGWARQV